LKYHYVWFFWASAFLVLWTLLYIAQRTGFDIERLIFYEHLTWKRGEIHDRSFAPQE
jgi:hypothetical protein